jgi:hypothetical protein
MRTKSYSESLKERDQFERPKCRWKDSIKMNLNEIWFEYQNWIHLAQDMVQWVVPQKLVNFLTRWANISYSIRILFRETS